MPNSASSTIAIIGGGAAGYFAAIRCKELSPDLDVHILERSHKVLAKVAISGGGRCNVTHDLRQPRAFSAFYPRGRRELLGPLSRFGPDQTVEWFESRGVELKTEPDGRMFPTTDSSQTIIDCLESTARSLGVQVTTSCGVHEILRSDENARPTARFQLLTAHDTRPMLAHAVLVAMGGHARSAPYDFLSALGHTIQPPVPSLFTLRTRDRRLADLSGVAVPDATVRVDGTKLLQRGAVLITHWGLSGPAVLQLSAWAAREFHARDNRTTIEINWTGRESFEHVDEELQHQRIRLGRRRLINDPWPGVPKRLWSALNVAAGIHPETTYGTLSRASRQSLAQQLVASRFDISGTAPNKEEFVTCGGVNLKEVDLRTMESRLVDGLYFAGEVLDIDGMTGGFNFQAAWSTGYLAGEAMALADRGTQKTG